MKTPDNRSFLYEKNQLIETICQLRFPTILSIDAKEPADFQDTIRADFPRYSCQMDPVKGPDGTSFPYTAQMFADAVAQALELENLRYLGACCGSTPEFILALKQII